MVNLTHSNKKWEEVQNLKQKRKDNLSFGEQSEQYTTCMNNTLHAKTRLIYLIFRLTYLKLGGMNRKPLCVLERLDVNLFISTAHIRVSSDWVLNFKLSPVSSSLNYRNTWDLNLKPKLRQKQMQNFPWIVQYKALSLKVKYEKSFFFFFSFCCSCKK